MRLLALVLTAAGIGLANAPRSPTACEVVPVADATALVGPGKAAPMGEGPVPDEDTGAQRSSCVYQGAKLMLVVMVLEYPSAEAAGTSLSKEMVTDQLEDESATVETESGLGDRAYWGTTDHSAIYVVQRGARVLALALGGEEFTEAAAYRDPLRKATRAGTGRL
jgi:hypothetical protein